MQAYYDIKVLKNNKKDTIIISWLCSKQMLCHKQDEIFNFLWCLLLLHTVEHIDIGLCGQAEPNLWKIFYCWEVLLIWNSLSLPAIDMKNWLKYGTILWKRLRTDWFLWTLSVYSFDCVPTIEDSEIIQ